jgi:hypothetical protein
MMRKNLGLISTLIALQLPGWLSGCAAASPGVREVLDDQNAETLFVATAPLVFARDRQDVAAHAHDFATLTAVDVDKSGQFADYLILYRWSTVDTRMSPPPPADAGHLQIVADGRVIDFDPLDNLPLTVNQRQILHAPAHGVVVTHAYRIDVATLRFIATSREIFVKMPREPLDTPFRLWEDGRGALARFLASTTAP